MREGHSLSDSMQEQMEVVGNKHNSCYQYRLRITHQEQKNEWDERKNCFFPTFLALGVTLYFIGNFVNDADAPLPFPNGKPNGEQNAPIGHDAQSNFNTQKAPTAGYL